MAYRGIATMRKRLIGSKLRRLREDHGMSIDAVAQQLGVGKSVVYRQETGHTATSIADAKTYLDIYGVQDPVVRDRMLALARACRVRGWWFAYGETAGDEHVDLADIEDLSTEFRIVNLSGFHTLLETEGFAQASLSASRPVLGQNFHIDDVLALRSKRRQIMDREDAPKVWAVIGESSLSLTFEDPSIMINQVNHLLELMERPNVSLQLLPSSSVGNLVVEGFMSIMGFDGTPDGSVVHTYRSFSDHPDQVKEDLHRFTYMQSHALSRSETRHRLEAIASAMRQNTKESSA
jgi:transcriptional regulator with XRE-family HTH domain